MSTLALSAARVAGYVLISAAAILIAFSPVRNESANPDARVLGEMTAQQLPVIQRSVPKLLSEASQFDSAAIAAYTIDLRTGHTVYEKNADIQRPVASLAKLMTAMAAYNLIPFNHILEIDQSDIAGVSQPVMGLVSGERISALNLLRGMLISSHNDAALALARASGGTQERFVEMMNQLSAQYGMTETRFANPAGFDHPYQYSTARDLMKLVLEFLSVPEFAEIAQTQTMSVASADGKIRHWLRTSNKLLERADVLGVKTGYTEEARGNLVILAEDDEGNQIITIVLGSEQREKDSEDLIGWIFDSYRF